MYLLASSLAAASLDGLFEHFVYKADQFTFAHLATFDEHQWLFTNRLKP
jgi:hypothetical protein